jgi:hypothetical protein
LLEKLNPTHSSWEIIRKLARLIRHISPVLLRASRVLAGLRWILRWAVLGEDLHVLDGAFYIFTILRRSNGHNALSGDLKMISAWLNFVQIFWSCHLTKSIQIATTWIRMNQ